MQLEITKRCADSLRTFSKNNFDVQIKSSHAHELVAAYMGYSSRAALLADAKCPITNLRQANILVLTPTTVIKKRRAELEGLPENLPDEIAEGVYSPFYDEKWILYKIWPTFEELGKALADKHVKSKPLFFGDMKVQRQGVKVDIDDDEVAIYVFSEYVSPSLTLSLGRNVTRGVVNVFQLKRVACRIGYVLANHHTVDAETLDAAMVKMRDFFHEIISSSPSPNEFTPLAEPETSFTDWLSKQKNRDSPLGDFAKDMVDDKAWPTYTTIDAFRNYLSSRNAQPDAILTLGRAWKTYQAFLKRKNSPQLDKKAAKISVPKKDDPRLIVSVKKAISVKYMERTIEKFNPGDSAWVSWDGRKAIPVTVIKAVEKHYSIRIERPLKNAGNVHALFLDEVRSTPELACANLVTL